MPGLLTKLRNKLRSRAQKPPPPQRGPLICWLPLLPTELRVVLLHTIGAYNEDGGREVMMLGAEFPEFGRLIIAIGQYAGAEPMMDPYREGTEIMFAHLKTYTKLPKKHCNARPVMIAYPSWADIDPPDLFLSQLLAGTSCSMLSQLTKFDPSLRIYTMRPPSSPTGVEYKPPLIMDCARLNGHTKRKPYKTGIYEIRRVRRRRDHFFDRTDMEWQLVNPQQMYPALTVFNCLGFYMAPFAYVPPKIEVRLSSNKAEPFSLDADVLETAKPTVCLNSFPGRLLHISFESYSLPIINELTPQYYRPARLHYYDDPPYTTTAREGSTFVLRNTHWSHANPYGMSARVLVNGSEVEMDQATYNEYVVASRPAAERLDLKFYQTVHFYGIPDSAVVSSTLNDVASLSWWRLTPRAALNSTNIEPVRDTRASHCPSLARLYFVSVMKKNGTMPLFHAPMIKTLLLVALQDSDVVWRVGDLFDSEPRALDTLYLERRSDPQGESGPRLAMTTRQLERVAPYLNSLHVRGYIPVFAMAGYDQPTVVFSLVTKLTLDLSEVGEQRDVTLALEAYRFPWLRTVVLMCTREAESRGALSDVKLDVLVGAWCSRVFICHLLRPLSLELNGQALTVDEEMYNSHPKYPTPVVPSRQSRLWKRLCQGLVDDTGVFDYAGEVILEDELFEAREY